MALEIFQHMQDRGPRAWAKRAGGIRGVGSGLRSLGFRVYRGLGFRVYRGLGFIGV